ncbi:MAG: Mfa1 family fimbria major subunit [Candidatus Limisoma sp.]
MKKFFSLILGAILVGGFASCNNDDVTVKGGEAEGEQVYLSFKVQNGVDTRSATTEDGEYVSTDSVEVGTDAENAIATCQIFLASTDGSLKVIANQIDKATTDTYVASFNSKDLVPEATYRVYIVCNTTVDNLNTDALYSTVKGAPLAEDLLEQDGQPACAGKFWMTNADDDTAIEFTMPDARTLAQYNVKTNPLNLGIFNVERTVARVDYKAEKANNIYPSLDGQLNIQLVAAAPVNMNNDFYMWKRVSMTGTMTDAVRGGRERASNWVVGYDYADKLDYTGGAYGAMLYPMTDLSTLNWTNLNSLEKPDNYEGDYKVWRYLTENIIPPVMGGSGDGLVPSYANQKNGITTGIVFKARLTANDGTPLAASMAAGKTIYIFDNVCYGTWDDVKAAIADPAGDAKKIALLAGYNRACAGLDDGVEPDAAAKANGGFLGYTPVDGNYECLYYYWVRHNDNFDNRVMGHMEFDIVRNNVYKLAVTNISKYGHPANTTDPDPDPVDPNDPDETNDYYFKVVVKVAKWVVRLNNIEF